MSLPKVSVITVVFKNPSGLQVALESVRSQSYKNIEHIVVDGGGCPETVTLLKKMAHPGLRWVSESDKGIYDAMNKGIEMAEGDWVNFMNGGDTFSSSSIVSKAFESETHKDKVLLYGSVYSDSVLVKPHPIAVLRNGLIMACHQSMFFNKAGLGELFKYDLRYPIYGDYELVNRIYMIHFDRFAQLDFPIANFEGGGVSSRVSRQKRKDKYLILLRHYGIWGLFRGLSLRSLEFF